MTAMELSHAYADTEAAAQARTVIGNDQLPLQEGQIIAGRYRVGRLVGAGGMGLVFEGEHIELGSQVAIKVIRPQLSSDPHIAQRFVNESRGVAALSSPHIARVFDAGCLESGEAYLVMERLKGKDLLSHLQNIGPLAPELAARFVLEACDGLAEAHTNGLIHRDIKPEHLFIVETPGVRPFVKVLDFGISKRLGSVGSARVTQPGDSIGSPCYMSPEQMQNPAAVDARTDVWSLGIVLYEALSARKPFDGDTIGQIQWDVIAEPHQPLRELAPHVPESLEAIVERCLKKDPDERFGSARALGDALASYLKEQHGQAAPLTAALGSAGTGSEGTHRPEPSSSHQRIRCAAPAPQLAMAPALAAPPASAAAARPASGVAVSPVRPAIASGRFESTPDLGPAGVPRKRSLRSVLSLVFVVGVCAAALTILGMWANNERDRFQWPQWQATLNPTPPDDALQLEPSQPWEPSTFTWLKIEEPLASTTSGGSESASSEEAESASSAEAESGAKSEPGDDGQVSADAPAPSQSRRVQVQDGETQLTPAQKRQRYEQWLKSQNLTPVGEVVLDDLEAEAD